jgi:non-ribosomal peptide synthetase component F/acyl carrier protein
MERVADILPLTAAQAGILVSSLAEPESGLYVVQMRFALVGRLDRLRLTRAWEVLTARNEMLRTAVVWNKTPTPVNVIMTDAAVAVEWLDLSQHNSISRSEALQNFLTEDRRRGFDLHQAPLSRVTVLVLSEDEWEMVWTHHHLVLDGWSTAHLMAELWRSYTGQSLIGSASRFRTFASAVASDAERNRAQSEAHWRTRITGADAKVAIDQPRRARPPEPWTDRVLLVSDERLERWTDSARRHGVTRSTLFHAGWAMALRAGGLGPDELTFGTVADTRGSDSQDVVGLCVTSTPLRIVFDDVPLGEWLRAIAVDRAVSHEHAGNLADHRTWSDDAAARPFQYLLAVEGYPDEALTDPDTGDDLEVRYLGVHESTEYALTAGIPAGIQCLKLTFDTRRIDVADATTLLDQWAEALDSLAASPSDQSLTELISVSPAASTWRTLPECMSALARAHPDRTAFRDASASLTLEELDRASAQVAAWLRAEGLRVGERVGVLVDDSVDVPVAMLATLMAGGVVVPLDPRHPAPFRAGVISAAGLRQILTSRPDVRPEWNGIRVESVSKLRAGVPSNASGLGRAGFAFLIYDTGSAVRPEATAYDHHLVMRTAAEVGALMTLSVGDTWVVTRPATGAMSPWEMWVAPLTGGCTVLAPGIQHEPGELVELISRETAAVVGVTRRERRDLAGVVGDRGRLVSATRNGTEFALESAAGEPLGRVGQGDHRAAAPRGVEVDGIPIDPADIESLLLATPGVVSCVVRQEPDGGMHAVVSITPHQSSAEDVTRMLRSSLPEGMVPQVVLAEAGSPSTTATQQRQVEQDIRRLWSRVLERPDVPLDTPFFDLGGDSLLLFAVLSGLKNEGWTTVEMTDLFAYPTVRTLSMRLCQPAPAPASGTSSRSRDRRSAVAARRERRLQ